MLDPTFATNGAFVSEQAGNTTIAAGLIDDDGRYVGVGARIDGPLRPAYLVRLTTTGALDPTFGGSGEISLDPPPGYSVMELRTVAERPDGRLMVAGHVSPLPDLVEARPIVCRLLASGAKDPAFGTGGCTTPAFGPLSPEELVNDMALQADGRIVLVGSSQFGQTRRPAILRLLANGQRDLCFNDVACSTGGAVITPAVGDVVTALTAVAIAPDQKIVAVGAAVSQSLDMVALRLLTTGAIDVGFGNAGSRRVAFEAGGDNFDRAEDVAVLADGSIIMAGGVETFDNRFSAGVAKLVSSGVPDIFFGQNGPGRAITNFTDVSVESLAAAVAIQPDGKIVVAGTSFLGLNQSNGHFAAWRLTPNGFSDSSFGSFDGRITITLIDSATVNQASRAIAVDDSHIAIMGVRRGNGQPSRAAMLRLDQHGVFAEGFE